MNPATNNTTNAPGLIASRLGVIVATAVGLVGLTLLIPNRDQLFSRFLADGDSSAASQLLSGVDQDDPAAVTKTLINELLSLGERNNWSSSSVDILNIFLRRHEDIGTAADLLVARAETIPQDARNTILATVIDRCLGNGDLDRAVTVQAHLVLLATKLTPELVRQAVRTYRYNSEPGRALVLINQLDDQSTSLPEDLRKLRVTLARETSQPDVAFNLLAIKIRASRSSAEIKKLIPEAVKIGVEAGHLNALIPLYQHYLRTSPSQDDPLIEDYTFRLAHTFEWTGNADKAFATYLTLAKNGNVEAMERCIKLNAGLYRPEELLETLLEAEPHLGTNNPFVQRTAQLLAEAARHDEAIVFYQRHLASNPDDSESHLRLGLIHDERQDFANAIPPLTRAHELDPTSVVIIKHLAGASIANKDYKLGLKHSRTLAHLSDDADHAEQFSSIAFSIGATDAYRKALARVLDLHYTPGIAIALANSHRDAGDISLAIAILTTVLEKEPNSIPVRLNIAQLHMQAKHPEETLRALSKLSLTDFPDAVPTTVDALSALSASPRANLLPEFLRKYGSSLNQASNLPTGSIIDLANLERRFGSQSRSRSLLHRALRECSQPTHLAQANFHLGNPREALPLQLAAIKGMKRPFSEDYHFLGDIYTALHQSNNARSAYNYAVVLLKKKLTRTPRR